MAHFAEIDGSGVVLRVLVVGNDQEHRGQDFLASDLGLGGTWLQCSYNATIRKNYPGIGFTYDEGRDAFIAPKPFPSWLLDEATCRWVPPVARPNDGERHQWDEGTLTWVQSGDDK
jgi:hypothetical protein